MHPVRHTLTKALAILFLAPALALALASGHCPGPAPALALPCFLVKMWGVGWGGLGSLVEVAGALSWRDGVQEFILGVGFVSPNALFEARGKS